MTLTLQQESDRLRGEIQGALGTRDIGNGSIGANGELRFTVPLTFTWAVEMTMPGAWARS